MSGGGKICGFPCGNTGGCETVIVAFDPAGYFFRHFFLGHLTEYHIFTFVALNINSINIPFNVITSIFRVFTYILQVLTLNSFSSTENPGRSCCRRPNDDFGHF